MNTIKIEKRNTLMIAHRGLSGIETENTNAAFIAAANRSYYGIETDIHLTRDGEVVICHDSNMLRTYGIDMIIEDHTLAELRECRAIGNGEEIPLFSEFLSLVDGQVPLVIELKGAKKDAPLAEAAAKILRDYKGVYCVESFNPVLVKAFAKAMPEVPRGYLTTRFFTQGRRTLLYWMAQCLLFNFLFRPDFIAYEHVGAGRLPMTLVCGLFRCHAVTWTIRTEEELKAAKPHFDTLICENIPVLFPDGEKHFR
jgi:glycerophosphoryl diester phosphodiesterase